MSNSVVPFCCATATHSGALISLISVRLPPVSYVETARELFYYGDWIKKPVVAIVSCNDGLRPVIMKLEATDKEPKIGYEPVER